MQKEPKQKPLSEEMKGIMRELDREFQADQPKTAAGNLLPQDEYVEINEAWLMNEWTPIRSSTAVVRLKGRPPLPPVPPPLKSLREGQIPRPPSHRYDIHDKKVGGVFKWVATTTDITPAALLGLRFAFVVSIFLGAGILIPLYLVAWLLVPKND